MRSCFCSYTELMSKYDLMFVVLQLAAFHYFCTKTAQPATIFIIVVFFDATLNNRGKKQNFMLYLLLYVDLSENSFFNFTFVITCLSILYGYLL